MRFAIAIVTVLLLGAGDAPDRAHPVTWLLDEDEARRVGDDFDWQRLGPLDFVEFLKERLEHNTIPGYTAWGYHRDWIRSSDLPALRELLTSREPCAPLSSVISPKGSTVGEVAKLLIEGYESGGFPAWNKLPAKFHENVVPINRSESGVKSVATEPN